MGPTQHVDHDDEGQDDFPADLALALRRHEVTPARKAINDAIQHAASQSGSSCNPCYSRGERTGPEAHEGQRAACFFGESFFGAIQN